MRVFSRSPYLLLRRWSLPVFLALGLIVGGADQEGQFARSMLQVLGALLLFWCVFETRLQGPTKAGGLMQASLVGFVIYGLVQLVPLPPEIWSNLPGREFAEQGLRALGAADLPYLSMSLSPQQTMEGLLRLLPPIAVFVLTYKTASTNRDNAVIGVVLAIAMGSALLGWAQLFTGRDSPFYAWELTNWGYPVGIMANANHQGNFLLLALALAFVRLSRLRDQSRMGDGDTAQLILVTAVIAVLTLGIIIVGSVAGYLLLGPVLVLSFFFLFRGRKVRKRDLTIAVLVLLCLSGIGWWLVFGPVLSASGAANFSDDEFSRPNMWRLTISAAKDHFPFGSGLGSFQELIPRYENLANITGRYIHHAHNDYLEVLLELGLPGALLLLLLFIASAWAAINAWREARNEGARMRKAATIMLGVVMLHSLVDYPLRTETIAMLAAFALGRLATGGGQQQLRGYRSGPGESHIEL